MLRLKASFWSGSCLACAFRGTLCFDFVQPVIDATFFHLYPPFLFEPVSDLFGGLELSTAQTIFERVDIVRLKRGLLSTVSPLEQGLYATRKIRFQPASGQ